VEATIKRIVLALATAAFVALVTLAGVHQLRAPRARPETAPLERFSAGRALHLLQIIAAAPHPMGSPAQAIVRGYIYRQLTGMDLQVQVERRQVLTPDFVRVAGTVHNVIGVLPGTDSSKAIVLVAHYDTVPAAPGAADDGSSVATLLEAARTLRTGPPLRNDVIFLFTDGEEPGLLGAQAFATDPQWAARVGVVLNFDNPGTSGPSLMYETSPDDGWLVRQFAAAVPAPFTSSLMNAAARGTWVECDFTPLRAAGFDGLNFASLDATAINHTGLDDLAHVDADSMQQAGDYAVGLARRLGSVDLLAVRAPDLVYFNLIGSGLVMYSERWVRWLVAAAGLGLVIILWWGRRRRLLWLNGVAIAATVALGTAIAAEGVVAIAWMMVSGQYYRRPMANGTVIVNNLDRLGLVLIAAAVVVGVTIVALRKLHVLEVAGGGLLWWFVFAGAAAAVQPGASYLFVWPLLFAEAGTLVVIALGPARLRSVRTLVAAALGVAPGLFVMSAVTYLFLLSAGLRVAGTVLITCLVVNLLAVLIDHVARPARWLPPAALAAAGLALLFVAGASASRAGSRPHFDTLFYRLDSGTRTAQWQSLDEEPDQFTQRFLSPHPGQSFNVEYFPLVGQLYCRDAPAPYLKLPAPAVTVVADEVKGARRTLRLHVESRRGAPLVSVLVTTVVGPLDAWLGGQPVRGEDTRALDGTPVRWGLDYVGLPRRGIDMTFTCDAARDFGLKIIDYSYGLPAELSSLGLQRPPGVMAAGEIGDGTMVARTFDLGSGPAAAR
jgi:hypothetical protein